MNNCQSKYSNHTLTPASAAAHPAPAVRCPVHLADLTLGAGALPLHVGGSLAARQLGQDVLVLALVPALELQLLRLLAPRVVLRRVEGLPPAGGEDVLVAVVPGPEQKCLTMFDDVVSLVDVSSE